MLRHRSWFALSLLALSLLSVPAARAAADQDWWKNAVIYEVYPRSYGDSNGDGIGDLNGITEHLDYLKDLGVDAIWITPFFPSPQVDFGYDISDYRGIDPQFGTMADFDRLQAEATKRNIRIIADMVLNHTSDQHPWFIESKSSRTNPKADWYVWRDGKANGHPPNNWISIFGHSAWQFEPSRKQFYYHAFYKEQPDLNWDNNNVKNAMYDVCRFWMQKGVAGFRLDAITHMFEDPALRDEPLTAGTNKFGDPNHNTIYTDNLPKVHDVLRELRKVTDEFPGRVLIGETYLSSVSDLAQMYGRKNDELQLPMDLQYGFLNEFNAARFRSMLVDAETKINGNTPLFAFDNHDNPRAVDRYKAEAHRAAVERLFATMLLTPKDAALLYYGEEIGMKDHTPKRKEDVQDPIGRIGWPREKGRDEERTPMQWNDDNQAGFSTTSKTWLPVGSDYKTINVAAEQKDPNSLLNFYKKLIQLRKTNEQLKNGEFVLVDGSNPEVLSYMRRTKDGRSVLISCNLSANQQTVAPSEISGRNGETLISYPEAKVSGGKFTLAPFGSVVAQLR